MEVIKIGILGVTGVLLALQFRTNRPEYGIYLGTVLCLLRLLCNAVLFFRPRRIFLQRFTLLLLLLCLSGFLQTAAAGQNKQDQKTDCANILLFQMDITPFRSASTEFRKYQSLIPVQSHSHAPCIDK